MKKFFLLCMISLLPSWMYAQVCFIHIMKTGGTTMHALLEQHFVPSDFYPYRGMKQIYPYQGITYGIAVCDAISGLPDRPLATPGVISGHFPLWWLEKKGIQPSAFRFTVLREPVDRVISHYFFSLKFDPNFTTPDLTPLDIFPNMMCRMLSSDPRLEGEELLADALRNLERLDFVIFMDDFEGGVRRMFKKMGREHTGAIPKLNETSRWKGFDQEMRAKIRETNALDIRLYEYAVTHLRYKSV